MILGNETFWTDVGKSLYWCRMWLISCDWDSQVGVFLSSLCYSDVLVLLVMQF